MRKSSGKSLRGRGLATVLGALAAGLLAAPAQALPYDWQTGFQPAASPVMEQIEAFHTELFWIILAVCVFVLALLGWIVWKYRISKNPVPSFRLLYFEAAIPKPDVHLRAIGKQWYWTYEYPGANAGFTYDSLGLDDDAAKKAGEPRLLGVDNIVVVPVNKVVEVEITGADVIHSWALPQLGVKMDAVPGRLNRTWFKATQIGTYYGECSELCGARHAFMPIEVKVVSEADYADWLASAKKKFAALDTPTKVAAK